MTTKNPKRTSADINCGGNTEVPFVGVPISEVHIDPKEISDADYEIGCRILAQSVRRFFEDPRNQERFEEWKKEYYQD